MIKYAPSLMCASYLNLEKDIKDLDRAQVDFYHVDVMDGHFVPNLALSFDMVNHVKKITDTKMDFHLMVDNPQEYLPMLEKVKPDYVSFHIETVHHPIRLIKELKNRNIKAGIAVSPSTGLEFLEYVIRDIDYILIMTVEPGYAGQKFIPPMLDKIAKVSEMRSRLNQDLLIEVDGNISEITGKQCIDAGSDILVLGTASIFKEGKDLYTSTIEFKNRIEESIIKVAN